MNTTDILTDPQNATHIKKQTKCPRTDCSSSGDAVEIKIDKQDHSCQRKGSGELNIVLRSQITPPQVKT